MMRRTFFWLHLGAGLAAGVVILVMSVTGVLLRYERQTTEWADGHQVVPPAPGLARLDVEALAARVFEARGAWPSSIAWRADPAAPAAFAFGRERKREGYDSVPSGRKAIGWLRFIHTGEAFGVAGQTVAGLASLGGVMLSWTGVALALRRFAAWRRRRGKIGASCEPPR